MRGLRLTIVLIAGLEGDRMLALFGLARRADRGCGRPMVCAVTTRWYLPFGALLGIRQIELPVQLRRASA